MQKLLLMILVRPMALRKKSLEAFAQRTNSIAGGNATDLKRTTLATLKRVEFSSGFRRPSYGTRRLSLIISTTALERLVPLNEDVSARILTLLPWRCLVQPLRGYKN
jgi:hypothetical protein